MMARMETSQVKLEANRKTNQEERKEDLLARLEAKMGIKLKR
jgi:hypothetical protein